MALVCPLFASSASGKLSPSLPKRAQQEKQGPGKEEPETCHHRSVCFCLALGRWAVSHNIWRKSGKFWHPAHCPAHRGTGTEPLQCLFSKYWALKPLISANLCVVSTGPRKATLALKLGKTLLRQRAAEFSQELVQYKEKIRNIFITVVWQFWGKKICWSSKTYQKKNCAKLHTRQIHRGRWKRQFFQMCWEVFLAKLNLECIPGTKQR